MPVSLMAHSDLVAVKPEFCGTDTDTDTDTDILADLSSTCPTRALFFARMSVRDARARVHVYTCTVHDNLSRTRLQNYTIGAFLMSVSVSMSVPWNSSLMHHNARMHHI